MDGGAAQPDELIATRYAGSALEAAQQSSLLCNHYGQPEKLSSHEEKDRHQDRHESSRRQSEGDQSRPHWTHCKECRVSAIAGQSYCDRKFRSDRRRSCCAQITGPSQNDSRKTGNGGDRSTPSDGSVRKRIQKTGVSHCADTADKG